MPDNDEASNAGGTGDGQHRPAGAKPTGNGPTGNGSGELDSSEMERPAEPGTRAHPATHQPRYTRTAGTWAAVVVATIALIVLLIFILQNLQPATVTFLWIRGNLPVGVALLLAAAIGGLLVALVGAARILQLRRTAVRHRKREHSHTA